MVEDGGFTNPWTYQATGWETHLEESRWVRKAYLAINAGDRETWSWCKWVPRGARITNKVKWGWRSSVFGLLDDLMGPTEIDKSCLGNSRRVRKGCVVARSRCSTGSHTTHQPTKPRKLVRVTRKGKNSILGGHQQIIPWRGTVTWGTHRNDIPEVK